MGVTDRVSQFAGRVQEGVKNSSVSLFALIMKLMTAFFLSLTLTLIGQTMMGFGTLSFAFLMTVIVAVVLRLMKGWPLSKVLIFDLFCVLIGVLLRMYILLAP